MNNKSKKMVKFMAVAACVAAVSVTGAMLAGCGEENKSAKGSATIDAQLSAANSQCWMPAQVASMLGATTEVTVEIEDESYTVTKIFACPDSEEGGAMPGGEGFSFEYTFTGAVTSSDGDTYVLAPATACDYSVSWGFVAGVISSFMEIPVAEGTGDETTDATCLNYFYGPYLAKAEDNSKSVTVTISDGGLVFDGFSIVPEV